MLNRHQIAKAANLRSNNRFMLFTGVLTVLLIGGLLLLSDSNYLLTLLGNTRISWLVIGLFVFAITLLVVSIRLLTLLNQPQTSRLSAAFDLSTLHTFLLTVLPAHIADACYPALLKYNMGQAWSGAVANLIVIRLQDVLCAALLFALSFFLLPTSIEHSVALQLIALALVGLGFLAIILMPYFSRWLAPTTTNSQSHWQRLSAFIHQVIESCASLSMTKHARLFSITLIRWLLTSLTMFCLFKALGITLSVGEILLITTGINLAVIIPLQTFGGFGLADAAMAVLLIFTGVEHQLATATALAIRLLGLIVALSACFIWLLVRTRLLPNNTPSNQGKDGFDHG